MLYELLSVPFVVFSGFGVYYFFSIYKQFKKYERIPGRKHKGILEYIIGDLKDMLEMNSKNKILPDLFHEEVLNSKSKTIKIRILDRFIVVTCNPGIIKKALIEQNYKRDSFYKNFGYPGGERFMGNSILSDIENNIWKHKRALLNPGFHKQILKTFIQEFNEKGDKLIENLKEISKDQNEPVRLLDKFNQTALDIIASVAFSIEIDSLKDSNNFLIKWVYESMAGAVKRFSDPYASFQPHKWPEITRHKNIIRKLRDFGRKQIEIRLEALKNGEELPNDILTTILKSHENEKFYVEDMVDNFVTFFIAGQETTASVLASLFMELGRNPDILEKLRNEIDKEIGQKEEISFEDLSKLKYTSCVFKETLRMYPPATQISRAIEEEIQLEDITIPKDSVVLVSIYSAGRNPDFFPEPNKFNPDRFLNQNNESVQNYTFLPFSLGPRNCIGQNFAQIEAKVLIAKLIQNIDFKLDMNQSFDLEQTVTLRPKDGTKCYICIR